MLAIRILWTKIDFLSGHVRSGIANLKRKKKMKITIDWSIRVPNFIAPYIPKTVYKFFDVIVKVRTGEPLSNKSVRTYLVKKQKKEDMNV